MQIRFPYGINPDFYFTMLHDQNNKNSPIKQSRIHAHSSMRAKDTQDIKNKAGTCSLPHDLLGFLYYWSRILTSFVGSVFSAASSRISLISDLAWFFMAFIIYGVLCSLMSSLFKMDRLWKEPVLHSGILGLFSASSSWWFFFYIPSSSRVSKFLEDFSLLRSWIFIFCLFSTRSRVLHLRFGSGLQ
ncbi:unnamed protein product [Ilex paraguariensis]|uniref:Uncharacterized protein n=1 Tax=Ilex paraguariensis TaxID=185542 RepID=A0ABC8R8B4_9AQUA